MRIKATSENTQVGDVLFFENSEREYHVEYLNEYGVLLRWSLPPTQWHWCEWASPLYHKGEPSVDREIVADLRLRIDRAIESTRSLLRSGPNSHNATVVVDNVRLNGKIRGLELVKDWLRSYGEES